MPAGYLSLVLHAHLPFLRHREKKYFLQERWFFEALTECYIPLIKMMDQLDGDGLFFRFTLSISPPLLHMFKDPLLSERYLGYLLNLQKLAEEEVKRTKGDQTFNRLARMYRDRFQETEIIYEYYDRDPAMAFKRFKDAGKLELITSGATHGYLPLLAEQPQAVKAQIKYAVECYREAFGETPPGFWLPECGYYPGVDQYLADEGIKYFFVDSHGLLFARPQPRFGTYAPITTSRGVNAFARDEETSKQVWSAEEGYPGDFDYREYYRDIGYDLEWNYIKNYIPHHDKTHTGIKYYRITGKGQYKEPYNPDWAREKAAIHAGNFIFNRSLQAKHLIGHMERPPMMIAPYDAELFGHWWYEGPQWLEYLLRKVACDQEDLAMITPSDYLDLFADNQPAEPCQSSWGNEGYSAVWLESSNDWIYRHLHRAARMMSEMANALPNARGIKKRALEQAARELLLAQSSDWAFIMKTGTLVDYARERTNKHLERFNRIYQSLASGKIDKRWLFEIAAEDNIFPRIDYRVYQ
ncbi:DUF1957 domain-containing protein [Metallumcola ferriviriculae]|uniref:DUF1957 domain-containing protein n=1 Tax=Metallumcola ferriviriculae TaxID=3039180 RepID=A0AAU0US65_9FIRM|nr:DUF1957 domain-containing protein [Desulfitibacteraceae bacterium MK1]